ncbi:MAG: helix-turn-helix transcriptional regulator [Flavobacterium sp.]|nr:helix-turn-helix transcriptional regulator [Flavobacterium sp.]
MQNPSENLSVVKQVVSKTVKDLPTQIVEELLEKLIAFEDKKGFLEKDCSVNTIAEMFKTNQNYLSRVVNAKKGMAFNLYISNLRIDYAIERLKSDVKFRSYTIEGIAHTIGFSSATGFANAFYAKTGIKPSYFIKQLNNTTLIVD